jgi:arginyl-tRNA synthetase
VVNSSFRMASTVPPIASGSSEIPARYALPEFPAVASANPDREPMDAFRLAVAKLISDAWQEPLEKIFNGVDTGASAVRLR